MEKENFHGKIFALGLTCNPQPTGKYFSSTDFFSKVKFFEQNNFQNFKSHNSDRLITGKWRPEVRASQPIRVHDYTGSNLCHIIIPCILRQIVVEKAMTSDQNFRFLRLHQLYLLNNRKQQTEEFKKRRYFIFSNYSFGKSLLQQINFMFTLATLCN